jgi:hypothetical protein
MRAESRRFYAPLLLLVNMGSTIAQPRRLTASLAIEDCFLQFQYPRNMIQLSWFMSRTVLLLERYAHFF